VAHSLSAKKRIRQSIKRRAHNRARKETIKESVKTFAAALTAGTFDKAETALREVVKRLDKVAAKGTIHKNTASRRRSRLAKRLNVARTASVNKPAGGEKPTRGGRKGGKGAASTSA
jgi:small subunit ribosomal protein S20